jgi:hypothetical protein
MLRDITYSNDNYVIPRNSVCIGHAIRPPQIIKILLNPTKLGSTKLVVEGK